MEEEIGTQLKKIVDELAMPLIDRLQALEDRYRGDLIAQTKEKYGDEIEPLKGTMALISGKKDFDPYANIVDCDLCEEDVLSSIEQLKGFAVKAAADSGEKVSLTTDNPVEYVRVEATPADTGEIVVETTVTEKHPEGTGESVTETTTEIVSTDEHEPAPIVEESKEIEVEPESTKEKDDKDPDRYESELKGMNFRHGGKYKGYQGIGSYFRKGK